MLNNINEEFLKHCQNGNIDEIKNLINHYDEIDLGKGIITSCQNLHIEITKLLLKQPDIEKNLQYHLNLAFLTSTEDGDLETVKYLLESPELNIHANIHADDDYGFINACIYNRIEIVQYLIFDCNIEETKKINNYLNVNKEFSKQNEIIKNMFKLRTLNNELKNGLKPSLIVKNKLKI